MQTALSSLEEYFIDKLHCFNAQTVLGHSLRDNRTKECVFVSRRNQSPSQIIEISMKIIGCVFLCTHLCI